MTDVHLERLDHISLNVSDGAQYTWFWSSAKPEHEPCGS
jgi:hypothetical protein